MSADGSAIVAFRELRDRLLLKLSPLLSRLLSFTNRGGLQLNNAISAINLSKSSSAAALLRRRIDIRTGGADLIKLNGVNGSGIGRERRRAMARKIANIIGGKSSINAINNRTSRIAAEAIERLSNMSIADESGGVDGIASKNATNEARMRGLETELRMSVVRAARSANDGLKAREIPSAMLNLDDNAVLDENFGDGTLLTMSDLSKNRILDSRRVFLATADSRSANVAIKFGSSLNAALDATPDATTETAATATAAASEEATASAAASATKSAATAEDASRSTSTAAATATRSAASAASAEKSAASTEDARTRYIV